MRHIAYALATAALGLSLGACNDDFMDRQPQTEIGAESFFNTEDDLRMYCYGLTDTPPFTNADGGGFVGDAGTDDQATTDMVEIKNIMTAPSPSSVTVTGGWDWKRLYDINFFLDHCDRAAVSAEVLDHWRGVARYYRAKFYMDKVKRYSDVPWYDHALSTADPELFKARDPRRDVVERIFEDYRFAADHVRASEPKGAVDRWIVLATMARHALYEGTFRRYHPELELQSTAAEFLRMAADAALSVIREGGFSLVQTGDVRQDYATLFTNPDLTSCPEIIQGTYYDTSTNPNNIWGAYMFGNYIPCPTKALVQAYLMADGSFYSSRQGYEEFQFVQEFQDRDPRMAATLAYPGWELVNNMSYATGAGVYVQELTKNFTGYHQLKGFPNVKDPDWYHGLDYPAIRYAEVLLTYAEARAELGELTAEDLDMTVNALRRRAGMPPMQMTPATDPLMAEDFPGVAPQLLEIRRERRVEMAFEGLRYDDLMRWGAGKLLERVPVGLYFPGLGNYDLTGDGIPDIKLIASSDNIPAEADKETNSLGQKLHYYRVGSIDDPQAAVYLTGGDHGNILTAKTMGTFQEPKFYYRPVPRHQMDLNPDLGPQLFGWD